MAVFFLDADVCVSEDVDMLFANEVLLGCQFADKLVVDVCHNAYI